jgi:hypothetical protein
VFSVNPSSGVVRDSSGDRAKGVTKIQKFFGNFPVETAALVRDSARNRARLGV